MSARWAQWAAGGATPSVLRPGNPRVAAAMAAVAPAVPGELESPVPESGQPPIASEAPGPLAAAQAADLRLHMSGLNIATALVCALFGALWTWTGSGPGFQVGVWVALGCTALLLRLPLQLDHLAGHAQGMDFLQARRRLGLATTAAAVSGAMIGWGWLGLVPHISADQREALLLAHMGLLLWALHASSHYVPAFMAFALMSLVPAVVVTSGLTGVTIERPAGTLALLILAPVFLMFCVRSARQFRAGLRLQDRVQRLIDEVTAKRDEAVLATQAKSRFLASVSHDLRQPMHAMNLYLASLAGHFSKLCEAPGDAASAKGVQEGIRSLEDSTQHLNLMFESLLDLSRLNAGSVALAIRHTTLHRMLSQLRADYTRQAAAQGMRFTMRVPAQVHLMEVQTDPALLERLLRNLLVNAFRYTRAGGVRLSVVARGRSLDFRVVDTGPGIERSMRKRVFEEFFQVPGSQPVAVQMSPAHQEVAPGRRVGRTHRDAGPDAAHTTGRGIGLGLSISSRLAERLGSGIRLHSKLERGSVFAFRQPMRIALRPQHESLPASARQAIRGLPSGLFLAVIDDDEGIRRSTRQMLEVLGAEVFTADSAAQAVQRLGRLGRVPDLLLSDYRLGAENGVQAIAMLREEFNQDIPAILITADTAPERLEEFRHTGLRVLYKPITGDQLQEALEEELRAGQVASFSGHHAGPVGAVKTAGP